MTRLCALTTIGLMVMISSPGLTGCGQDDSKRASAAARRRVPARDMTPEQREEWIAQTEQAVLEMWIWQDGDPPHDARVDTTACTEELQKKRNMQHANPLVKLTWLASCMRGRGWELDPNAELPEPSNG